MFQSSLLAQAHQALLLPFIWVAWESGLSLSPVIEELPTHLVPTSSTSEQWRSFGMQGLKINAMNRQARWSVGYLIEYANIIR